MSEYRSRNTAGNRNPQRAQRPNGQRPAGQRPGGQRPAQHGQRRPKQSGRRSAKRSNARFIIFLAVIAVLAIGGGVLVATLTGGGSDDTAANNNGGQNVQSAPTPAADSNQILSGTVEPESTDNAPEISTAQMVQVNDLSVTQGLDGNWMNVLLLGSDQRDPAEPFRTDSMIICSINTTTGEVKLTSLMRDTAIQFDNLGEYSGLYRLNLANYFGGPQLLIKTLNECLGLNIEHYAMVDFTSFAIIADQLGGIEIDVSMAEMEEINFNLHRQARVAYDSGMSEEEVYATYFYLEEYGENVHLTGPQVLGYARIRKLDSDSQRTERQRKVLIAMLDKLRTRTPQDIISLAMDLGGYVTTNMTLDEIINVALVVLSSDLGSVQQLRVPVQDTYLLETRDGESMLYDTDWAANTTYVHEFIYGN